ncbi:MAG: tetratricopeptide repeat protein [Acidobacteriia bacterium]|nr:tetratricopeptide repeat protein [Terriglobia bacterium]
MFLDRAWKAALAWSIICSVALAQPGGITTGGASQRPIVVRGRVALSDGGPLPEKAALELLCNEQAQPQGRTDAEGNFSVDLGLRRYEGASDASIGSAAAGGSFGGPLNDPAKVRTQVDGASIISLVGCSLRAALKGYTSERADLSRVRLGEPVNVGTIILHRIPGGQDPTVSATSLAAPRNARQSFERARQQIARNQFAEAEKELVNAVQIYPKYAEAWQDLGVALLAQNKRAEARKAFREAVSIDPKFISPYYGMAELAMHEQKWEEMAQATGALLKLDPYSTAGAYAYDAMAQLNLNHLDAAEKSAREGIKLDTLGEVPKTRHLLGVVLMRKGDYTAAAEHLKKYLEAVPDGPDTEFVKRQLSACEARQAARGPAVATP